MLEKFQPIKIANRSYWLNAFPAKSKSILTENDIINILDAGIIGEGITKLKSILTENDNIIKILDAGIIGAGITNLVFC